MSRSQRSSGHTEPETPAESRPWTACSSNAGSVGDRTSRSSRASKSNLISPISEADHPALPPDAWKRRSMKRSSYDYKHMSIGVPEKEAAEMIKAGRRHSMRMTPPPIDATTSSPVSSPEFEPPMPPIDFSFGKFVAPITSHQIPFDRLTTPTITSRDRSEQHDMHAELHWEINAGNPRNWTKRKKWIHTVIPCTTAFVCMLASTILTPTETLAAERKISSRLAVLPTSLYMLGLASGSFTGGLGAGAFGRAPVYLMCIPLFAAFTLAAAFISNFAGFATCRLFAGFFSSPILHMGYGTLADTWTSSYRTWTLPTYTFSMLLGTNLGPVIGSYVADQHGIKWTQYTILFAIATCLFLVVSMQETSKKVIVRQKEGLSRRSPLTKQALNEICVKPLHMLFTKPIILAQSLYSAYSFGVLYSIYAALPALLGEGEAFTISQQGLVFIPMVAGVVIALLILFVYEHWHYQPRVEHFKEDNATEDERSLYTGRRSSRFLIAKPSKDSLHSSIHAQNSRRNSIFQSLKGLSSGTWKTSQPQDDAHRNAIMAMAAATFLAGVEGNAKKQTSAERLLPLLDQHLEFEHFCMSLEGLNLKYDRLELAKVLVDALATNASPSTNLSMYARSNTGNSSLHDIEKHRKATVDALEAAASTELGVQASPMPPIHRRKTWTPPTNVPPPEWRLWLTMPASALVAGALFMLGWTVNKSIHRAVPPVGLGLYALGLLIALVSTLQYVLECYSGADEPAVLVANTTLIFLSAAAFPLFATDVTSLGPPVGFSLYASISALFGLVPILLYRYGPALRRRQKDLRCSIRT